VGYTYTQVGQEVRTVYRWRRNIPLAAVLKRIAKSGRTAVRSATVSVSGDTGTTEIGGTTLLGSDASPLVDYY